MREDLRIEAALLKRAAEDPKRACIVDGERVLSHGEVVHNALAVAAQLRDRGVERGDRVAVFLDKSAEAVACIYGVWMAGCVLVPVAPTLRHQQVEHILNHSGHRVLIATTSKLRAAGFASEPANLLVAPKLELGTHAVDAPLIEPKTQELAAILYTSGSTGAPKGVAVSHEGLCAGSRILGGVMQLRPDDRMLSVLPFSFRYGLNQLLKGVRYGACVVLQRALLPGEIVASLGTHQITVLAGVPTLWLQLLETGELSRETAPVLRLVANGGGVFPLEAVAKYRQLLPGCDILLMYGTTEAFRSTYLSPAEIDERPGSIGRAVPEAELLVLDENDQPVGPGEVGELVHRGPTVALGYWNDPETTAAKFRFDPEDTYRRSFRSGDLIRKDADGCLYFVGRRDEMIKAYGYRISPNEVEALVTASSLVREVVVGGVPDPGAGARVVIHCVPAEGFSESALMAYCRREMPSYMVPKEIVVADSFPRTASGKIDRTKVKQSYQT